MRIGPFNITRAAKPSTQEIGRTGTDIFGGFAYAQEYNAALTAPASYDVYDKMANDGHVAAALRVIKLPLINAEWKVEPASDKAIDKVIAGVIEEDFLPIWRQKTLQQALKYLNYGNMPFEAVWKIGDDGLVRLQKLAPRSPRTITEYLVDDRGELQALRQQAAPDFRVTDIPASKIVLFINEQEGADYRGRSLLRAAYKHWTYVDGLERVAAIAAEKRAVGVDVGKLSGEGVTQDRRRDAEAVLSTIHAHEKNYVVEVDGQFDYRLETGGQGFYDALPLIQHHNLSMIRSMLVEFIAMGAGSTGSLAMHRDKTSYLLLSLGAISDSMCETVHNELFVPWVGYNWAGAEAPMLRVSRLEQRDVGAWAESVTALVKEKVLTNDESLEAETRELLSLPGLMGERDADMMTEMPDVPTEELVATVRNARAELKRRRVNDMV